MWFCNLCVYISLQHFEYDTNMIVLTIYLNNETYFLCHFLTYSSQWTQKLACNKIWMLTYTCWMVTCIVLFSIWRRKFYFCHNSHKIRQNWIIHLFKHLYMCLLAMLQKTHLSSVLKWFVQQSFQAIYRVLAFIIKASLS